MARSLHGAARLSLFLALLVAPSLLLPPPAVPVGPESSMAFWATFLAQFALGMGVVAIPLVVFAVTLALVVRTGVARRSPGYPLTGPVGSADIVRRAIQAHLLRHETLARIDAETATDATESAWSGLLAARRCCAALHRGSVLAAVPIALLLVAALEPRVMRDLGDIGPGRILPGVAAFCLIAGTVLLCLARTLRAAVTEAPGTAVARETWRASRERATAVAEIHGDARNVLIAYCVTAGALVAAVTIATATVLGVGMWSLRGPGRSASAVLDAIGSTALTAAQPFATGALSVLTVGALAGLFSAQKKLTTLRAEVARRQREWDVEL